MQVTNIQEAKAHLSKLIERVEAGEQIVIGKAGKPVAMLVPYVKRSNPLAVLGVWRGKGKIHDDFDELPEEIAASFRGDLPLEPPE